MDPGPGNATITVAQTSVTYPIELSVSLTTDDGDQAAAVIQDITYTAVNAGTAGNSIEITYVDPGLPNNALSITVVGDAIEVSLETDGTSTLISDADDVQTAINLHGQASLLVSAVVSGTGSTVQTVQAPTNLVGGGDNYSFTSTAQDIVDAWGGTVGAGSATVAVTGTVGTIQVPEALAPAVYPATNPQPNSTAGQIKLALDGDPDASDRVTIVVSGTGTTIQSPGTVTLEGGTEGASDSTAQNVKDAIDGDVDASALVTATITGTAGNVQNAQSLTRMTGGFPSGKFKLKAAY